MSTTWLDVYSEGFTKLDRKKVTLSFLNYVEMCVPQKKVTCCCGSLPGFVLLLFVLLQLTSI